MAAITLTVGAGRTYSTIPSAGATIPTNIVASGNSYTIEVFDSFTGTGPFFDDSGFTTDATHNVTIKCGAGASFYDNANKLTNKLQVNSAYGVALVATGGTGNAVHLSSAYTVVDGLMLGGNTPVMQSAGAGTVVKNCIAEGSDGSTGGGTINVYSATVINCVAINTGGGTGCISNGGSAQFHNVTSVQIGSVGAYGFRGNYDSPLYVNCGSFGFATAFRSGTSGSSDYNVSDDTTAPGTHTLKSKTAANQFVNITNTSARDIRVKAGADLIAAGTRDATYTADLDVVKQARSTSAPTIGAWEYVASGTTGIYAATLGNTALAAAGTVTDVGSFATTMGNATMASSGLVGTPPSGAFAATMAGFTVAAAGAVTNKASFAALMADCTLAAAGAVVQNATGTFSTTMADAVLAAYESSGAGHSPGSRKRRYLRRNFP